MKVLSITKLCFLNFVIDNSWKIVYNIFRQAEEIHFSPYLKEKGKYKLKNIYNVGRLR